MVVDSMSIEEVAQELLSDLPNAQHIADYRYQKYKSLVLKSRQFPVIRYYECKTVQKNNRFFVNFTAMKRGQWSKPFCHYYCIYVRPEGLYCAIVGLKNDYVYIYPPHFFARYRERIIKRDDISPEDLIHLFMSRFWSNFSHVIEPKTSRMLASGTNSLKRVQSTSSAPVQMGSSSVRGRRMLS